MYLTGNQVRQSFIDFFAARGHTVVPSASLVPGGDSTLLFTNSGMVQFKDVFLGTDIRPYTRAVDSQKCLRVSGKHNDLDTVGRDNTHHTFFEMLGNWSFGDYFKDEAIAWSWELLTSVWGLDKSRLYATVFRDEEGVLPQDDEAAAAWLKQPGFDPTHLVWGNRHDNLWEMAETGPCGPCSEIHYDFGPEACDLRDVPGHVCQVNGDCKRIVEIWNNVFIQYNRVSPTEFLPLPKRHVDTGMGFERIVSIIQNVKGNYETDLLKPLIDKVQALAKQTDAERQNNLTPYRVIADHVRAASFLMADGVIPGNIGRNYVCRMIIRRASRFARKLGLTEPFMAQVAQIVIDNYSGAYPELKQNEALILSTFTREEKRFNETLDAGFAELNRLIDDLKEHGNAALDGKRAFELYATLGFPLEITRDILSEAGLSVDEGGFFAAMEEHRVTSGRGHAFGDAAAKNTQIYADMVQSLVADNKLPSAGVVYDPYSGLSKETTLLALFAEGEPTVRAHPGETVELLLAATPMYLESGGQVMDTGRVFSNPPGAWEVAISAVSKPAAGAIIHTGEVISGSPKTGDPAIVEVDQTRRRSIMRNHTATHLLHAALRKVLGDQLHQSGSAVDADGLRFDFNFPEAVGRERLLEVETEVNRSILGQYAVVKQIKTLDQAKAEGAMALFGEKYGAEVRTIQVGANPIISYELCGGTHVSNTIEIASFFIVAESSIAAGVRRIEAITGQKAYKYARARIALVNAMSHSLEVSPEEAPAKLDRLKASLHDADKEIEALRAKVASAGFADALRNIRTISGVSYLTAVIPDVDIDTLRGLTDQFRQKHPSGIVVLGASKDGKPSLIAAVTPDLIARGLKAGDLIKRVAAVIGGGGGGRPELAQAGGKDASKLSEALDQVAGYIEDHLK
ncbi:MAG TPA: alanine--tRNA ligase [Anaerolineaceae bacterium]|nr:alanine--tRNA ligase [Anaerolineaceae bacterium]